MNSLTAIPAIVWLLVSALFYAIGEYLSKRWGTEPSFNTTLFVVIAYALCGLVWLPALLHKNQLTVMGTIWLLLAVLATIGIGIFVYHETLNTLQWAGVAFAVIALILLGTF